MAVATLTTVVAAMATVTAVTSVAGGMPHSTERGVSAKATATGPQQKHDEQQQEDDVDDA